MTIHHYAISNKSLIGIFQIWAAKIESNWNTDKTLQSAHCTKKFECFINGNDFGKQKKEEKKNMKRHAESIIALNKHNQLKKRRKKGSKKMACSHRLHSLYMYNMHI